IAFPRSPTVMAHLAWDLAALSGGRFILGLGTQVKAHMERRFGVGWDPPAPKLREYVGAMRAVWRSWQDGAPLRVDGRYYRLSLAAAERAGEQIALYASTPSYRVVLHTHGWDGVAASLQRLAAERRWTDLPREVPEAMLDAVLIRGSWEEVGRDLRRRYAGVLDRVACYRPFTIAELPKWRRLAGAFHGA